MLHGICAIYKLNATVGKELIQQGETQSLREPMDLLTIAVA
jgi:hypothetical protein